MNFRFRSSAVLISGGGTSFSFDMPWDKTTTSFLAKLPQLVNPVSQVGGLATPLPAAKLISLLFQTTDSNIDLVHDL
ncbi:hypothetical protein HYR69_01500 [Candidatus Sumerlaeota bacterium]|nr:hypothetical protein [Candidatus Sumerlaeota bacterium]